MHTIWNYSDTGRGMSANMSFLLLPVRFRGTPHMLHSKTIHIASRRVLVSFYVYITNICRLQKKLHQKIKIQFPYLSWIFRGSLGRPTVLGTATFTAVDFTAFVECALFPARRADFRTVLGLPHPLANTLHIHIFKKIIRNMSEHYG
jgi:hypothetical protein